jgi:hypothetical protein
MGPVQELSPPMRIRYVVVVSKKAMTSALFPQAAEESLKKMVPKLSLDRTGALQVLYIQILVL